MSTIIKTLLILVCVAGVPCIAHSGLPQGCKYKLTNDGIKIQAQDLKNMGLRGLPANFTYRCENKNDKGVCVPWKGINVQSHGQAITLAKEFAKRRNNVDIICSRGYFTCGNSDQPHIVCVTKDAKWNKDYYEFIFNDMFEQSDKKWHKGVGKAECITFMRNDNVNNVEISKPVFNGKTLSYDDAMRCDVPYDEKLGFEGNRERNIDNCTAMDDSLRDNFGFSVLRNSTYGYKYEIDSDGCVISFGSVSGFSGDRQTCNNMMLNGTNVDNNRFHTLQGQLNQQMVAWLGGYVQRELDEPLETFDCKYAFSPCSTGDITNPTDDILKCTANGNSIYFRFDDLSETKQGQLDKTDAAMKCMNTRTGAFDGRRCRGLSPTQCDEIGKQVPGGTRWDSKLQACVLNAANKQANLDRVKDITLSVGIPASLLVIEVATGGGATPIVFAAIGTATAGASEIMTTTQRASVQKYLSQLEQCTTAQCVKEFLEEYLTTLSSYEYNLPADVISTLDEILSKKIQLLSTLDQDKFVRDIENVRSKDSYWNSFLKTGTAEWTPQDTQAVLNVVSIVSSFIPLSSLAIKFSKNAKGFLQMPKTAKAIRTTVLKLSTKTSKRIGRVGTNTNTVIGE